MKTERQRLVFYCSWALLLLLQVPFIELMSDEAYYWCYAQQLDFGYLDHPPMTAVLIKTGTLLLPGELGVRVISIVLSTLGIYLWERIVNPKNLLLFYALVVSVGMLHFIGFMAIPDAPLLFFAGLFLYQYRRITEESERWLPFVWIGLAAGCMLLSKYHGILVIVFVIFSNVKLLWNPKFWVSALIATIVFLPHILWQVVHSFLSLKFHLSERSFEPYDIADTFEYLITQLFILGPVVGFLFFYAVYKTKSKNQFERALKFTFWGFIIFFFLLSFKGNVEAHWTFITVVPGLYFGYHYLESKGGMKNWLKYSALSILFLTIIGKGVLMVDMNQWFEMPLVYQEWQSNEVKSKRIAAIAGDRPVGFMNSYQKASLYQFYTRKPAFSLNNANGRRDQFDVWKLEQKYIGEEVLIVSNYYENEFQKLNVGREVITYKIAKNFQYYRLLKVRVPDMKEAYTVGDQVSIDAFIKCNQSDCPTEISKDHPTEIRYHIFEGEELVSQNHFAMVTSENIYKPHSGKIELPKKRGTYRIQFNVKSGWIPAIRSERYYEFEIR